MIQQIHYCKMDGEKSAGGGGHILPPLYHAAVAYVLADGRTLAFADLPHHGWTSMRFDAVMSKSKVLEQAEFETLFPGLALPDISDEAR